MTVDVVYCCGMVRSVCRPMRYTKFFVSVIYRRSLQLPSVICIVLKLRFETTAFKTQT